MQRRLKYLELHWKPTYYYMYGFYLDGPWLRVLEFDPPRYAYYGLNN